MSQAAVIVYDGEAYDAGLCERCGGLIHPPELLERHIARHIDREKNFREFFIIPLAEKIRRSRL